MAEIKNGDPFGHDPLVIARTMAQNGIVLVSCSGRLVLDTKLIISSWSLAKTLYRDTGILSISSRLYAT